MSKKSAPKKKSGSQAASAGKRFSAFSYPPDQIVIIGLDTTDTEDHPLYDAESLAYDAESDEAMIANVRYHGVIEPVVIMRDGPRNIVIDGRSRVRWARCAAKLQRSAGEIVLEVPYIVRRGKPAELYGVSRAANRRRPEDSPVAQARQLQRAINYVGNEERAAKEIGLDPALAKKLLRLLESDPKVQIAVERGMSLDAAAKLAKLPHEQQRAKLAEIQATGKKPSARAVTNKLREGSGLAPVETPAQKLKKIVAVLDDLENHGSDSIAIREIRAILRPPSNGAARPAEQEAEFGT